MKITNTKEIGFEEYIEKQLVEVNGYKKQSNTAYQRNLCLDPEMVLEFINVTQADAWGELLKMHGEDINEKFFKRLSDEVRDRGVLDVLRNGFADHGVNFKMAYYPPNSGMNEETIRLFESNVLSAMRQVHYSEKDVDLSLDTVIFLNGLPIFTIELKNQLTGQSVQNAIRQYRTDRDPKEPLFVFKRCLAHFAVDTKQVYMTTKLAGLKTYFLPFNKGYNSGAGNPPNADGYMTSYLWEDIWTKKSVLELVGKFITLQKEKDVDSKGREIIKEKLIFPRYHQRDTVQRLIADARDNSAGQNNYLIQHSAGSGKSNTIGWTAHRLSELYNADDKKVFDTVLVITDRRVLDRQLRDTVTQFEQRAGVVKAITEGSKELQEALEGGEKIIITTLQKFPFIVDSIGNLPGKNFAVIIDEAHSSQSGEGAANLREALTTNDLSDAEKQESDEPETTEDMVLRKLRSRKIKTDNISFFAFTATPKQKTLELFGTKSPIDGKYYPFSLYSMKQAIEERFILDVLKNYTTYQAYFALLKKVEDDPEFDKKKAQRLLIGYVEKHEHAIAKKVEIMAEHFRARIAKEIHGKAKAMIVTKSRLHAVRYKQAMDVYLREHNYPFKALVAFSGVVKDGVSEYSEGGMNGVSEKQTAETFKQDDYRFLIVAEKFQTGFDQPLLGAMYVDKKLGGVNAVQTLSRLNRTTSDKEEVLVLDFVNDMDDIKEAFQPYYTTTVLSEGTDPNILHDLERDLYAFKLFTQHEVDGFVHELFHNASPATINAILDKVIEQYHEGLPQEQEDFRKKCTDFVRRYAFAAQIIPYESSELEKLYTFTRLLLKKIPRVKEALPTDVLDSVDMESYKLVHRGQDAIRLEDELGKLDPMQSGQKGEDIKEHDRLSKIINDINDRFGTEFSVEDVVITNQLGERLVNNPMLQGSIKNNTRDAAKIKFDEVLGQELVEMLNRHFDFYKKLDKNPDLKTYFGEKMFDHVVNAVKK